MGAAIYWLLHQVIWLYQIVVIIYLVTRLLIQFNVVNSYNQVVQFILKFGAALVEPLLDPIRRILPSFGGIDLSPLVLLLLLGFLDRLLLWLLVQLPQGVVY